MNFNSLKEFFLTKSRMSHIYQPVLFRALVDAGGSATVRQLPILLFLLLAFPLLLEAQTLQTLFSFDGTRGINPYAALTLGTDGVFYGTTAGGGTSNAGTIFRITTNGALTTLVNFSSPDGIGPVAALTMLADGTFYGTAAWGGSYGKGTVFKVTPNGTLTTLASFDGTNGVNPLAALTMGNDGNFYGTTRGDGSQVKGTIFQFTTNGTLTKLVDCRYPDGEQSLSAITLGNEGVFYGTANQGGSYGNGTVFKVTTNGTLTTLLSFGYTNGYPGAALVLGNDGNFYGTTAGSGGGKGTIFQVTTNGTLTNLVSFNATNGAYPQAALTLGPDGNFYGTTAGGGSYGHGTIFRVATNGTLTTLVSFNSTNGATPYAGLTLGNDGNFYGTTYSGGSSENGTVFRLLLPLSIIVQPQNQTINAGATTTFLVSATSLMPLQYQWRKNGTNLINGGNISGATTTALTITGISESDAAIYSVIVSSANASSESSNATLIVVYPPIITAQPKNLMVLVGTNVTFSVSLTGSASFFHYQWRFNGTNILNATNAVYTIAAVSTNKAGNYSVAITNLAGIAQSSNTALTVVLSPANRTNYAGSTATFNVTAFSPEPLSYQWQRNCTNLVDNGTLSGATNQTLTIASVSDSDAANYSAIVSDGYGNVKTSNAVLAVNDFPFIAIQPQNRAILAGGSVTFNVTVYGALPFVFQWYHNGTPVGTPTAGTNSSSYTLTDAGTNQAGYYTVQAVNGYGSVSSSNALLTVLGPPSLAIQLAAGYPLLALSGMLSNNFVVQYSTNLSATNWVQLLSLTNLQSSPYRFLDSSGGMQPARFYRTFMQ